MTGVIKVIYVDDEPLLLQLAKIFLEKSGEFLIETSTSANKALTNPAIQTYDAIISDYQMPDMDGIAFLKIIREHFGDIPFILFTGKGREEVVIDAINNGADFYIQKGGDPKAQFAELAHKIRQAVKRRQAEDELVLLKTSVDQAYDEVFWLDFEGNILYVNEAACRTTGYSTDELRGMKVFKLDPDFTPDIWAKSVEDLRKQKIQFITTRHRCKDGRFIDVEIMTSYVQKGGKEYSFAFVHDISDRKQSEEAIARSREYLNQIFSSVKSGIVVIDSDSHKIIDINPSGADMIGLPKEEIIGNICHKFICPAEINQCPITDLNLNVDNSERILITHDGKPIPIIKYVTRVNLEGRECLLETFLDNSERKKAEQSLRESEEKFRSVFENSPYPIAINSLPDNKFLEVNKAFLSISGYTEAEVLGKDPIEMGMISKTEALKLISHRLIKGKIENVPLALTAKERRRIHVLFSTLPITINNKPAIITMTAEVSKLKRIEEELIQKNNELNALYEELTITEEELRHNYDLLTQKEQALREKSETFQAVVEQSNEGIIITDFTGNLLYANQRAADIVDYDGDPDTAGRVNILDFVTPDLRKNAFNALNEVAMGNDRSLANYKINTLVNKEKWLECIGRNISFKESPAMLLSFRDTTDRMQAEEKLRESEFKFVSIFKSNPVSLTLVSAKDGVFTDVNEAFLRSTGYTRSEVIGTSAEKLGLFPDDKEYAMLVSSLLEKHSVLGMELHCRIKTGEIRTCRFSSSVILIDEEPQILSTIEDITERRHITDAIRESEERYRLILKNANEAIMVNELTPRGPGKFIDANESACRILGMTYEELQNVSLIDLDTPEMKKRAPEIIREIKQNQHSIFQTNYLTKDNREKIIDISVSLFDLKGSQTMLSVVRDITDQKASESAFNALVSGMVGTTGRESLDNITESISEWLGADCVMIGEITPDQEQVRVLSMILEGNKIQDYSYTLKGTPCEDTVEKGFCIYPDDVALLFPGSRDFREFNIRGYAGSSLRNSEGQVMGILSIMTRNPLNLPPSAREIIDIILAKAAAELERMNALNSLTLSEQKFRTLVEHSLDGILILDFQGKILFANNAALKLIDLENPDGIIGTGNVMEFIDPSSKNDALEDFIKVAQGVDGYIARYKIVTVKQEERWVESLGKSIIYQNSQSILISLRDITEQKRAEEVLRKTSTELQQIITNMINAFVIWESVFDEERKYVSFRFGYFNDAYAEISKLNYEDVRGKDVFEVWPTTEQSWVEVYGLVAVTGIPHVFDMYHEPTKGIYHCNAYRPTESPDHICVIFEDITERKLNEEALRRTNKKLNLLSGITRHDITNKLTILSGCLYLLHQKDHVSSAEKYFSHIELVIDQITNMIQFTREYEEIGVHYPLWQDLHTLVINAENNMTLENVVLNNNIPGNTEIFADPLIIKVFFNLIDNAIRHGKGISTILFLTETRNNDLIIICADDGKGVAIEEKEKIFNREFGKNTGYGLYISREILDITNITIKETGEPGKGARFEIIVPEEKYRIRRD